MAMKYLPLIWAGLWRKPVRTIFTLLSIMVAFVLFGILSGIDAGFADVLARSRLDRLFTDPRFGTLMPMSYGTEIAKVPGVTVVAPRMALRGYYQEPANGMGVLATDERFFAARTEMNTTKEQIAAWLRTRTGAIVGVATAKRFGWKVGDRFSMQANIPRQDGSRVWTFDIVALMEDVESLGNEPRVTVNYAYLDEERAVDRGMTDRFILRIDDPSRATQISRSIDALFANSSAPTRTFSERSSREAGVNWIGDVKFFTNAVLAAVAFMLLFLTGNTMMQSVRERTPELAVLKTLGFSDARVVLLILAEAALLCALAALAGLAMAKVAIPLVRDDIPGGSIVQMPWVAVLTGLALALLVAFVSALIPAMRAKRLSIVDALAGR
jgi:putative ABC transport system permease protein